MQSNSNHLSGVKAFSVPLLIIVGFWLELFLSAGSVKFWEAWIWWVIISAMTLFITNYF